ncbi:MAG: oligosaccharide flippase family protein [Planctomycetota bacterium]
MPERTSAIPPGPGPSSEPPAAGSARQAGAQAAPKKKLSGQVLLVTLGQIADQAGIIVLTMILARILSEAEYGTFRQLWMLHRTLLQVCMLGIPMAVVYYLPKLAARAHRGLITRAFWMLLGIGTAIAWSMYLGAGFIAEAFNNPTIEPLLKVFGLFTMLIIPARPLRGILVNYGRANLYALFTILHQGLLLTITVGVLLRGGDLSHVVFGLVGLAGFHLLGFMGMMVYIQVLRPLPSPEADADGLMEAVGIKAMLVYAFPIGFSWIIDALNVMFDKLIAAVFFSIEEFARYANGAFHVPLVSTIVASTNSVLLPEYVRMHRDGDTEGILRLWHKSVIATAMLFFPIVAFLIAFSTPFVTMMFSATYADSAVIFQVYVLAMLPRMTYYSYVLLGMGLSKEQFAGSILSLVTNICVSLGLIKLLGAIKPELAVLGPALGTVLADVVLAGYFLNRISAATQVGFGRVFPWTKLGKLAVVAALAGLICYPLQLLPIRASVLMLMLGAVAFATVLVGLLWGTGQFTTEDRAMLLGMMPKALRPKRFKGQ